MLSATHMLTKVDDNTMTIQSKDRTINGVVQPDVPETTLKKAPAAGSGAQGRRGRGTCEEMKNPGGASMLKGGTS